MRTEVMSHPLKSSPKSKNYTTITRLISATLRKRCNRKKFSKLSYKDSHRELVVSQILIIQSEQPTKYFVKFMGKWKTRKKKSIRFGWHWPNGSTFKSGLVMKDSREFKNLLAKILIT